VRIDAIPALRVVARISSDLVSDDLSRYGQRPEETNRHQSAANRSGLGGHRQAAGLEWRVESQGH
jgi:oligoribonuclease NrnB/cAMP/cGMP phosphodiesterase (DHH superfamily)